MNCHQLSNSVGRGRWHPVGDFTDGKKKLQQAHISSSPTTRLAAASNSSNNKYLSYYETTLPASNIDVHMICKEEDMILQVFILLRLQALQKC